MFSFLNFIDWFVSVGEVKMLFPEYVFEFELQYESPLGNVFCCVLYFVLLIQEVKFSGLS